MTNEEAIKNLYELVEDINTVEIPAHTDTEALESFCNSWRTAAKYCIRDLMANNSWDWSKVR